jgi:hypothetical protein
MWRKGAWHTPTPTYVYPRYTRYIFCKWLVSRVIECNSPLLRVTGRPVTNAKLQTANSDGTFKLQEPAINLSLTSRMQ